MGSKMKTKLNDIEFRVDRFCQRVSQTGILFTLFFVVTLPLLLTILFEFGIKVFTLDTLNLSKIWAAYFDNHASAHFARTSITTLFGMFFSWIILTTIFSRAQTFTLLNDFTRIRPHIKMLDKINKDGDFETDSFSEIDKLLFKKERNAYKGPQHELCALDTQGPFAWIASDSMIYESKIDNWSKVASIREGISALHDHIYRGLESSQSGQLPFYYYYNYTANNAIVETHQQSTFMPRKVSRIYLWYLDEITHPHGAALIASHYEKGYNAYILPRDWYSELIRDFLIWDVTFDEIQPCHSPRLTDQGRLVYGFRARTANNRSSPFVEEHNNRVRAWDYIGLGRYEECRSLWKELLSKAITLDFIRRAGKKQGQDKITNMDKMADRIRHFNYNEEKKSESRKGWGLVP
jgi:hypothetical protein